jgi:hypothetical protein
MEGNVDLVEDRLDIAFTGTPISHDDVRSRAFDYLKKKYGDPDSDHNRVQIETLFQALSKRLIELIARDPRVLDHIEWREVERLIAEAFGGLGFLVELTPSSKDGGKDVILRCTVSGKQHTYVVEVKHWRSGKQVGPKYLTEFLQVVVREGRDSGLFLSTYGFSGSALETLAEIERQRLRIGTEEKIVSLCRTYVNSDAGFRIPADDLPSIFLADTE